MSLERGRRLPDVRPLGEAEAPERVVFGGLVELRQVEGDGLDVGVQAGEIPGGLYLRRERRRDVVEAGLVEERRAKTGGQPALGFAEAAIVLVDVQPGFGDVRILGGIPLPMECSLPPLACPVPDEMLIGVYAGIRDVAVVVDIPNLVEGGGGGFRRCRGDDSAGRDRRRFFSRPRRRRRTRRHGTLDAGIARGQTARSDCGAAARPASRTSGYSSI